MSEDQFTKLFNYIEEFRGEVSEKFENTASQESLDRLTNTIDSFVKRLDDAEIEQVSRDEQFKRLLNWAREVSKKTGIPLRDL